VKFSIERQINTEHPAQAGQYPSPISFFGKCQGGRGVEPERVALLLRPAASFSPSSPAPPPCEPHRGHEVGPRLSDHPWAPARSASRPGTRPAVVLEKTPRTGSIRRSSSAVYRPIVEDQARLTELLTAGSTSSWACPPISSASSSRIKGVGPQADGAHVWYLGIQQPERSLQRQARAPGAEYASTRTPSCAMC